MPRLFQPIRNANAAKVRVRVGAQEFPQNVGWSGWSEWGGEVAYRDLRDFLKKLDKEGELKRISAEVDPVLEITEISDRAVKCGGPALLLSVPEARDSRP